MPRLFRGRSRRWLAAPVLLIVVTGSVGAWLLTRDTSSEAAEPTTSVVAAETVQETVAASGTIAAARTADLDFAVSGTVVSVFAEAGDRVRKGDRLAAVDASALVAYRDAAAASLSAAYTQLEDDQDADASGTQLAADEASIVSAEASLEAARQDVRDATLRASIAGTVVSLDVAVGDVVGTSSGADLGGAGTTTTTTETTTASAVSIVSTNSYVVDATVSATDVARLKKGLQAEITPTGLTETVYGTVQSVGLVAETSSSGAAVFPVTIAVTGAPEGLYAGTSAEASIVVKQIEGVLTVPTRSLTTEDDTTYVTALVDGTETRTEVETGTTYGMSTEVVSGLAEGDTVVVPAFTAPSGGGGGGEMELPEGFVPPDFSQLPGGGQFEGPPQ